MSNNPLSGHTAGTNDGLRDGDHILSPSLTNLYEGVHGNGILLPHDTAYSDSDRNDPADLPGAISAGSAANQFVVKACDVILDGVLYAVGGGSDTTITLTTTTSEKLGTFTALTSGKECIFVVVATPEGIKVTQTTPITTASGAYASISGTAASYLTTGVGSGANRQSVVLGTVRATNAGGSTVGDLAIQTLSEYNDKRVFVRPTPLYLSPVRDGNKTSTSGISDHTALREIHGTNQHGTFGDVGVIWQSFNDANESMLYYSSKDGSNRHTHLLGPTNISVASPGAGTTTFKYDDDRLFVLTPTGARTLTPSGTFPPGHTVFVSVPSGSTVTFTGTSPNTSIAAGNAFMFAYDGTNWKTVLVSGTVSTAASGVSGLVQLSDGAGGFTSDTTLSFNTGTNTLTVDGKLTVTGLIDPTGLVVDEKADTAATGHTSAAGKGLYWVKSDTPNRPMFTNDANAEKKVIIEGDNISELTNDSGFTAFSNANAVSAVGNAVTGIVKASGSGSLSAAVAGTDYQAVLSEGAFANGDKTKLDGIASGATANAGTVTSIATSAPITGGTITSTGTIGISAATTTDAGSMSSADKSKLDGIAANATAYNDAAAIAAIQGANLTLGGSVTVAPGQTFSAPRAPTVAISSPTALTEATHAGRYLICTANVTLPATSSLGEQYIILNTSGGNITITPDASTTINGGSGGGAVTVSTFNGVTCIAIGSNNWIALGV